MYVNTDSAGNTAPDDKCVTCDDEGDRIFARFPVCLFTFTVIAMIVRILYRKSNVQQTFHAITVRIRCFFAYQ